MRLRRWVAVLGLATFVAAGLQEGVVGKLVLWSEYRATFPFIEHLPKVIGGPQRRLQGRDGQASPFNTNACSEKDLLAHKPSAIGWLIAHQSTDGSWNPNEHPQGKFNRFEGANKSNRTSTQAVTLTSLTVLALLSDGTWKYDLTKRKSMERGLDWLMEGQDPVSGFIGIRALSDSALQHALACMALAEAGRLTGEPQYLNASRAGYQFYQKMRAPFPESILAYREDARSVSRQRIAWFVLTSASGERAGTNAWALDGVAEVRIALSMRSSHCGTSTRESRRIREERTRRQLYKWHGAGAILHTQLNGRPSLPELMEDVARNNPSELWDLYMRTLILHRVGGPIWGRWKRDVVRPFLASQRKEGNLCGSYDPNTRDCEAGGRVYATALAALIRSVLDHSSRLTGTE